MLQLVSEPIQHPTAAAVAEAETTDMDQENYAREQQQSDQQHYLGKSTTCNGATAAAKGQQRTTTDDHNGDDGVEDREETTGQRRTRVEILQNDSYCCHKERTATTTEK